MAAQSPTPPNPKNSRRHLITAIAIFILVLIGVFAYNRALLPAPDGSGDLNSNKVEGGKDLSRK